MSVLISQDDMAKNRLKVAIFEPPPFLLQRAANLSIWEAKWSKIAYSMVINMQKQCLYRCEMQMLSAICTAANMAQVKRSKNTHNKFI